MSNNNNLNSRVTNDGSRNIVRSMSLSGQSDCVSAVGPCRHSKVWTSSATQLQLLFPLSPVLHLPLLFLCLHLLLRLLLLLSIFTHFQRQGRLGRVVKGPQAGKEPGNRFITPIKNTNLVRLLLLLFLLRPPYPTPPRIPVVMECYCTYLKYC